MSTDKAPADSPLRLAFERDLTQLIQDRDQWKARTEQLEAAAQQERARLASVGHATDMDPVVTINAAFRLARALLDDATPVSVIEQWRDQVLVASHPPPTPEDR